MNIGPYSNIHKCFRYWKFQQNKKKIDLDYEFSNLKS